MDIGTRPCRKCGKMINLNSLLLHEGLCNGPSEETLEEQQFPPQEINRIHPNQEIFSTINLNNNHNHQNGINIPRISQQSNEEEFFHCAKCDIYLDIQDREDHLLCHRYEYQLEEEEQSEGESSDEHIRNYQSRGIPRINSNIYENSNSSRNIMNNSSNNSTVRNVQVVTSRNGVRTETITNVDSQGRVTTVTRTFNSGNQNNLRRNLPNLSSDEDDEDIFGTSHTRRHIPSSNVNMNNLNTIFSGRLGGNRIQPITIFSNQHDLETFFQHVLQGINPEHPVDQDLLNLLPEITIEDTSKLPSEKRDCVVCLTKYEVNDKVLILPCTHLFHSGCIKDWFKSQNTCPICKYKINKTNLEANN